MQTKYKIEKETVVEALDDIEAFIQEMERITDKDPKSRYTYDLNISKEQMIWMVVLTLKKDEQEN